MNTLQVLNGMGHLTMEWAQDPEQVAHIRAEVEDLKRLGYSFFLVGDEPADEVTAGNGKLLVKRMEDPVTEMSTPPADLPYETPARRGRPPKEAPRQEAVAVRPQRGG